MIADVSIRLASYRLRGVVLTFLLLGSVLGCGKDEPVKEVVRPVRAMKVADVAGARERTFPGRAQATEEINLAFRVAGPLVERPVNVGDSVQQGDLIARIDPRDFETELANISSVLARAQAELQAMRVARPEEVSRLEAALGAARAEQVNADANFNRVRELFANDNASRADFDQARAQRDVARQTVRSANENLRIGRRGARAEDIAAQQANIRALEAQQQRAKDALEDSWLRAPFAGYIAQTFVENYQNVQAKQPIVRLLALGHIEMVVDVPESLISLVPYVKDVQVRFDAFPDLVIPAKVKEVGTEASQTTRTFPVTVIMEQPEGRRILPGMAGRASTPRVTLPDNAVSQGVDILVSALFSDESDQQFVWVIDDTTKTVTRRQVTVGNLSSSGITVTKGLAPGEWIATAGVHFLRENQKVRILQ